MDVYRWALKAKPGDRVIYYHQADPLEYDAARAPIMSNALKAHELGLVFLAQRRIRRGPDRGQIQYEATRVTERTAVKLGILNPRALAPRHPMVTA